MTHDVIVFVDLNSRYRSYTLLIQAIEVEIVSAVSAVIGGQSTV